MSINIYDSLSTLRTLSIQLKVLEVTAVNTVTF